LAGCGTKPIELSNGIFEFKVGEEYTTDVWAQSEMSGKFHYIVVDGHEYLVYSAWRMFGLTHSPRCRCFGQSEMRHEGNQRPSEDN